MSFRSQEEINITESFQDELGENFEGPSSTAIIIQKKEMLSTKPEQNEKIIVALHIG